MGNEERTAWQSQTNPKFLNKICKNRFQTAEVYNMVKNN